MPLQKRAAPLANRAHCRDLRLIALGGPLEELLVRGGDRRLALVEQRNSYGCTPSPRPALLDFGSSTASTISRRGFARAEEARLAMWRSAVCIGIEEALDARLEEMRDDLRRLLDVPDSEIVFSPSGTDAQLQALFLAKALLGTPLTTIIVGADQTGSGTTHTAAGFHFSDCTSVGCAVEKALPVAGLADGVRTIGINFCDDQGHLRSDQDMDRVVLAAVENAIARGENVLLQAMASSKLGWCGPSDACLAAIDKRWPDQVCIVIDACQMRRGRAQMKDYLARGYFVLATGSKFFTGPAFSGALLVPASRAAAIGRIAANPQGLQDYSSRHDWPGRWQGLRCAFAERPNHGQWLRWEAALAEMGAYFSVPQGFRDDVLSGFAAQAQALFRPFANLRLMAELCGRIDHARNEEMRHRTIFAFVPYKNGEALSAERCAQLYRTAGRDGSQNCQIGQPVALRHRAGAALRLCLSARLLAEAWERSSSVEQALVRLLSDARAVLEKFDGLAGRESSL